MKNTVYRVRILVVGLMIVLSTTSVSAQKLALKTNLGSVEKQWG